MARESVVYVSCGEPFIDPCVTKSEHQRRKLLAKLTNDVSMLKAYCDIKNVTGRKE